MFRTLILSILVSMLILGSMSIIPVPYVKPAVVSPCYCGGPPDWQATRESVYGWPFHFQEKISPLYGSNAYKRPTKSYQVSLIENFIIFLLLSYGVISIIPLMHRYGKK